MDRGIASVFATPLSAFDKKLLGPESLGFSNQQGHNNGNQAIELKVNYSRHRDLRSAIERSSDGAKCKTLR